MIASDQGAKAYCSVLMINLHDNHEINVCISQVSIEAKSEKLCLKQTMNGSYTQPAL
jgi:hypothetical protein